MEVNWRDLHKDAMTTLEGEFPVIITAANSTVSSTSKPMIKVETKIESGQYAGRKIFSQFVVSADSPGAMRMFFTHMAVFGLNEAFFHANPSMDQIAEALVNRRATAVVKGREWQGSTRESIEGWKPALGGPGGATPAVLGGLVAPGSMATTLPSPAVASTTSEVPPAALGAQPSTEPPADPF